MKRRILVNVAVGLAAATLAAGIACAPAGNGDNSTAGRRARAVHAARTARPIPMLPAASVRASDWATIGDAATLAR